MGAQMYNANIQENKVYGIILKEAKLFDDNINYQSSRNVDRGNKVLILDESEDMFLIKLSKWAKWLGRKKSYKNTRNLLMKIGLLSDTHSTLHPKVFEHFKNCDEIWHAGDIGTLEVIDQLSAFKPLRAVYGNIDNHKIRAICPKDLRFECEGVKVWITHIGGYPYNYTKNHKGRIR